MLKRIADKVNKYLYWPLLCLTAIVSYGYFIVIYTYGVNDEVIEHYVYDTNMVAQDRIGVYLINKVLHCYDLLPFWGGAIGLIFLCMAAIMWVITLAKCMESRLSKCVLTVFACCLISFPYIGKTAIWTGNLAIVGQVLLLVALCSYFYYCFLTAAKKKDIVLTIMLGGAVLCFDKAYVTTVILGLGFIFLCYIRHEKHEWKKILLDAVKLVAAILAMVVLAVILVWGLQKILKVSPSHYTSTYFRYGEGNIVGQVLRFIVSLVKKFIGLAKTEWSAKAICISVIGTLLIGILDSIREKSLWNILVSIGLVIDLGLIYIITGNLWMPERSVCHVLSLFVALFIVNLFGCLKEWLDKVIIIRYLLLGIVALTIFNFSAEMEKIYFEKYKTYEKDKALVDGIMKDIYTKCGYNTQKPIVFMGVPNNMTASWPAMEKASVFSWGRLEELDREEKSKLLYAFINANGYTVKGLSSKVDFKEIRKQISGMENWPEDNSIEEFEEYILVKLGDSKCEICSESREQFLSEYILDSPQIMLNQNELRVEGRNISLSGWAVLVGGNAYTNNVSLALVSQDSPEHYKIRVEEVENSGVTQHINDGYNYNNSGYKQSITLSGYTLPGTYDLMLILENEYGDFLINLEEQVVIE